MLRILQLWLSVKLWNVRSSSKIPHFSQITISSRVSCALGSVSAVIGLAIDELEHGFKALEARTGYR